MRIYPEQTVDGEFKTLGDAGFTGSLNDRQFSFLRGQGLTNSLADMMSEFKISGGGTAGSIFAYMVADGAWSPHYNAATAPSAVYDPTNDRILYAYESGDIGTRRQRKAMVVEIKGGTMRTAFAGDVDTLNADDHGVPAVNVDASGRAYVFYGSHNDINGSTGQQVSVETTAGGFVFTETTAIAHGAGVANDGTTPIVLSYAYPHPMVIGSDLWLSFRHCYGGQTGAFYGGDITKMTLAIRKASGFSGGIPTGWDAITTLIDCGTLTGVDGFAGGSRVYHGQNIVVGNEIYMPICLTDSVDSVRRQPGIAVYNVATGTLRNVANTWSTTTLPIDYATAKANLALRQQSGSEISNIPCIAFDTAGRLHFLHRRGANSSSTTFWHQYWNGSVWSDAVDTGVTVDNDFDLMTIASDGAGGLEALYVQDPDVLFNREGQVWRKTWTLGGGWTSGSLILDYASGRPGRGRPINVDGLDGAWVIAEKSPGTTGAPGSTLYGQHRCWLYQGGAFVNRTVANPAAPVPGFMTIRAGGTGFIGAIAAAGDAVDPFPVLSLVSDAGGMVALADDGLHQNPNLVAGATPLTEGDKSIVVRSTNAFGVTTDTPFTLSVRAGSSFEPEDQIGTIGNVFRAGHLTHLRQSITGAFVQSVVGGTAYEMRARNKDVAAANRLRSADTTRLVPVLQDGDRVYLDFPESRMDYVYNDAGGAQNPALNAAFCIGLGMRLAADGTAATPLIFGNATTIGQSGRWMITYNRAANQIRFQIATSIVSVTAPTLGTDFTIVAGQTSAGNLVLRVNSTENAITGAATATNTTAPAYANSAATAGLFCKSRLYKAVVLHDVCPDSTGRENLATWLASA